MSSNSNVIDLLHIDDELTGDLPDLQPPARSNIAASVDSSQSSSQSIASAKPASLRRSKEAAAEKRRLQKRKSRCVEDDDSDDSTNEAYLQKIASGRSPAQQGKKKRVVDDDDDSEAVQSSGIANRRHTSGTQADTADGRLLPSSSAATSSTTSTSTGSTNSSTATGSAALASTTTSPTSSSSEGAASSPVHVDDNEDEDDDSATVRVFGPRFGPGTGTGAHSQEDQQTASRSDSEVEDVTAAYRVSTVMHASETSGSGSAAHTTVPAKQSHSGPATEVPPTHTQRQAESHQHTAKQHPSPSAASFSALPAHLLRGTRVRRGPSWRVEYWDQDGGAGRCGTVGGPGRLQGWVTVRWDASTSEERSYRYMPSQQCCDVVPVQMGVGSAGAAISGPAGLSTAASASAFPSAPRPDKQAHAKQGVPIGRPKGSYFFDSPDPSELPVHDAAAYLESVRHAKAKVEEEFGARVRVTGLGSAAPAAASPFQRAFAPTAAERQREQDRKLAEAAKQQEAELAREVQKRKFLNSMEDRRTKAEAAAPASSTAEAVPRIVPRNRWDEVPAGRQAAPVGAAAGKRSMPRPVGTAERRVVVVADRDVCLDTAIKVALLADFNSLHPPAALAVGAAGSSRGRAAVSEAQIQEAFACLGLDPRSSNLDIAKKRFRALALYLHPDKVVGHIKKEASSSAAGTGAGAGGPVGMSSAGRSPAKALAEQQARIVQQAVEAFKHVNAAYKLLQEALQA